MQVIPSSLIGLRLVTALASACTFALGTSLQHRAGGTTPMVVGVALAVPLRAALSRHLPCRREMGAVLITTVGLAVFSAASPEPSSSVPGAALTVSSVVGRIGSAVALALLRISGG